MIKRQFINRRKHKSIFLFLMAFLIAIVPDDAFNFPAPVQAATTLVTYPAPAGHLDEHHLYSASTGASGTWQNWTYTVTPSGGIRALMHPLPISILTVRWTFGHL